MKRKKAYKAKAERKVNRSSRILDKNAGKRSVDIPFAVLVFILLGIGLVMLFSASYVAAIKEFGNMYYYFNRQLFYAILGIAAMIVATYFRMSWIKSLTWPIMILNVLLLFAVLAIGTVGGGAKRWIVLGPINFQPSEITKLAIVIYFSYYISKNYAKLRDPYSPWKNPLARFIIPKPAILAPLFVLAFNVALIVLEKHMSATIIVVLTALILLFTAGVPGSWFAKLGVLAAVGLGVAYKAFNYIQNRVYAWQHPFENIRGTAWQTVQSLYAIGSGGLLGTGLGNSVEKHLYLPEPQNDFIFAIVCEELGVVGAILIICIFGLLVWRGFTIALRCNDTFKRSLVVGIMSIIAIQLVLNIAVVTNLIPVTGISMPFFSYGGSALIMLLFEMGLVLNVSRSDMTKPGA